MVSLDIPTTGPVLVLLLYFGLTTGWHLGTGMTYYNDKRKEGTPFRELVRKFLWRVTHHYDLGVGIMTVGFALIAGVPPTKVAGGVLLIGFGIGIAYDDREDHPPEGMIEHILKQIRGGTSPTGDNAE